MISEQASVECRVWDIQSFQLALDIRLRPPNPLGLSIGYSSKLGWNEQLDACVFGGRGDFHLSIDGFSWNWNGTDNDVYAGQGMLD